ncbi:MAG: hypothetical protein GF416_02890 [Candidatus Altiarchaeales archaeon]|nr:hypothetical protein [Candidatus Altiarchaeales archaeon]MBD3416066.1 hypothetical protein [Candidatus Altiarchaeales archaeon]
MSRLAGFPPKERAEGKTARPGGRTFSTVLVLGVSIAVIIAVVLVSAALFSLAASKSVEIPSLPFSQTSSTTTSTTSTSSSTSTSSTLTSSTTVTSTTSPPTSQTTTTTASTTTTLNRYQVALCMSTNMDELYIGTNLPSDRLLLYLGEYESLFPVTECRTSDDKDKCNDDIREFVEDDMLFINDDTVNTVGYPVLVRGPRAYLIPSPKKMEDLLGCGSLEGI